MAPKKKIREGNRHFFNSPIKMRPFDYDHYKPKSFEKDETLIVRTRPATPQPIERNKYTEEDWLMLLAAQRDNNEKFEALVKAASEIKIRDGIDPAVAYLMEHDN